MTDRQPARHVCRGIIRSEIDSAFGCRDFLSLSQQGRLCIRRGLGRTDQVGCDAVAGQKRLSLVCYPGVCRRGHGKQHHGRTGPPFVQWIHVCSERPPLNLGGAGLTCDLGPLRQPNTLLSRVPHGSTGPLVSVRCRLPTCPRDPGHYTNPTAMFTALQASLLGGINAGTAC